MADEPVYIVELRGEPKGKTDTVYRLRRALKVLLRAFGLRCVSVVEKKPVDKDALILALCHKLYCCSRLLTNKAERIGDADEIESLMARLRDVIFLVEDGLK